MNAYQLSVFSNDHVIFLQQLSAWWGLGGAESTRDVQINQIQKYKPLIALRKTVFIARQTREDENEEIFICIVEEIFTCIVTGTGLLGPIGCGAISRAYNDGSKQDHDQSLNQDIDSTKTRPGRLTINIDMFTYWAPSMLPP